MSQSELANKAGVTRQTIGLIESGDFNPSIKLCIALYLTVASIKNGIWDRKFKANTTTNLIFSLMAGGFVVIFEFFVIYKRYSDHLLGSFAAGIFTGIFTFILTFAMLEVCTKLYKKKRKQLEQEDETE